MVSSRNKRRNLRYLRVANSIRQQIIQGVYKPGERMVRQHDLARQQNVAFTTLKQALDTLEREGYVVRRAGQGTYAALPEVRTPVALVVDDDEQIRDFFLGALVASGWDGIAVSTGEAAFEQFTNRRLVDLIFLDLVLPGIDGVETFRQIRRKDPQAYVVIITGYPDSDLMAAALEIGPFAVMKKPFSLNDFRLVLGNVAQSSAAAVGA